MTEKFFEIKCTIKTNGEPFHVPATLLDASHVDLKGSDGTWYRLPADAEITEITPLQAGYYIVRGETYIYRVLLFPFQIKFWNGDQWLESRHNKMNDPEKSFKEFEPLYLGPLDMNTVER